MKGLAFDQATICGWTFGATDIPREEWVSGRFRAPKRPQEGERLLSIFDNCCELIERFDPDIVIHEEPYNPIRELIEAVRRGDREMSRGYNPTTIAFLERVKGMVQAAAAKYSRPTEGYTPREWRTWLELPRKPEGADDQWIKRMTLEKVLQKGAKVTGFDEADSWGLCHYALHGRPAQARAQGDIFEMAGEALGVRKKKKL